MRSYRWACLVCLVMAYLVVTAGATVRASGSGMGCPDWPKCFGYLIPPTEIEQVKWAPGKSFQRGNMIIHPNIEDGAVVDRLLVARDDFVTGERFDPSLWTTFDRHDYAIFNPVHTWTEFVNRFLGALISIPVMTLVGIGIALAIRKQGFKPLLWSLLVMVQLGFVGWLGREVVFGNLTPNSITVHMLAACGLIVLMFLALSTGRVRRQWPRGLGALLVVSWAVAIIQIGIGTQVREAVDQLNKSGVARSDWIISLPIIYFWHKLMSWLVSGLVIIWFGLAWRKGLAGALTWICLGLLVAQAGSGVLLAEFGFPAIFQPVHLVAAMLLGGLLWWSLIGGASRTVQKELAD